MWRALLGPMSVLLVACRPAAPPVAPATQPAAGASSPAPAAEATPEASYEDISPALAKLRAEHDVPSLAVAVVGVDGLIAMGADGLRRADEEGAVTIGDKYHLGSDTKAMTATAAARLVERGALRWDLTVAEAFGPDGVHAAFAPITLAQLLRHRGGVAENSPLAVRIGLLDGARPPDEHRKIVASVVLAEKPAYAAGEFHYSNLGYVIAGALLERVTGTPWETMMRDELFEPLGMSSCGFGPPAMGDARDQPWAHRPRSGRWIPTQEDNPPYYGPAATVHCSLADWAKFAQVHFEGSTHVSAESLAVLHEPIVKGNGKEAYAMGWITPKGGGFLSHDGSNGLNYASVLVVPRRRLAVLVACNAGGEAAQRAVVATTTAFVDVYVRGRRDSASDQNAGRTRK